MCYVARGAVVRPHCVRQIDTPEHRHLFRQSAPITQKVTGVRENIQRFRRRIALRCRRRGPQGQVKIEFLADALGRRGLGLDQRNPLSKVLDGLSVRRAAQCKSTGLEPVIDGAVSTAGFRKVARQQFRLPLRNVRELAFESFGDAGVQRGSRLA